MAVIENKGGLNFCKVMASYQAMGATFSYHKQLLTQAKTQINTH